MVSLLRLYWVQGLCRDRRAVRWRFLCGRVGVCGYRVRDDAIRRAAAGDGGRERPPADPECELPEPSAGLPVRLGADGRQRIRPLSASDADFARRPGGLAEPA